MDIRPRFLIRTKDDLFFAVNTYFHPETHYVAFLRYVPDDDGDRFLDGQGYRKVCSDEAYEFIEKNHPEYLFYWNIKGKKHMGVLKDDVDKVYNPIERLNEIVYSDDDNSYYSKIRLLSSIFHDQAGISYDDMGVTGSTLLNLNNESTSDIDFIVFGKENHRRAIELFSKLKEDTDSPLDSVSVDYGKQVYEKRIKDASMSLDEFMWYESRKNNRGLIDGTLFDILCTRNPDEIVCMDEVCFEPLDRMKIRCKVLDDEDSYDVPAIYIVSEVEILEGPSLNIEKIVSFTHTYTGIVKNDERILASGVCEKVTHKDSRETYNLIIGTTRESMNEFIKLEKISIKKED